MVCVYFIAYVPHSFCSSGGSYICASASRGTGVQASRFGHLRRGIVLSVNTTDAYTLSLGCFFLLPICWDGKVPVQKVGWTFALGARMPGNNGFRWASLNISSTLRLFPAGSPFSMPTLPTLEIHASLTLHHTC